MHLNFRNAIAALLQPGTPYEAIKHTVIWVEEASKKKKLLAILRDQRHFKSVGRGC